MKQKIIDFLENEGIEGDKQERMLRFIINEIDSAYMFQITHEVSYIKTIRDMILDDKRAISASVNYRKDIGREITQMIVHLECGLLDLKTDLSDSDS